MQYILSLTDPFVEFFFFLPHRGTAFQLYIRVRLEEPQAASVGFL